MNIVSMKKFILISSKVHIENVLKIIQSAGFVHIIPLTNDKSKNFNIKFFSNINKIIKILTKIKNYTKIFNFVKTRKQLRQKNYEKFILSLYEINFCINKKYQILKDIEILQNDIKMLMPWGFFDINIINEINKKTKLNLTLGIVNQEKWDLLKHKPFFFEIINKSKTDYYILFSHNKNIANTNINILTFSIKSLQILNQELLNKIKYLRYLNKKLHNIFYMTKQINDEYKHIKNLMDILAIKEQTYNNKYFYGLQGYIPQHKVYLLKNLFKKGLVTLSIKTPSQDDNVPVMLENTWFTSSFESILKMFSGISYHEKDVTSIISILFIWFGALCFLDGGYGFLLFLLGWILIENNIQDYGIIFMSTGIFTFLFGMMNGQVFGLVVGEHIFKDSIPFFKLAIDPFYCLSFSLLVGLLNSGSGHLVALWKNGTQTNASGGLALVSTCLIYLLFTSLNINIFFTYITTGLMLAAVIVLWVLYPETTFGKSQKIANIVWTIYNGFVGLIQDTLSHMRLFGISLSGAILALVVNQISTLFPLYIQIPFCIIGHMFVFVLSLVSLCVHTNRLIFLEFGSKCIDGGKNYYSPLVGVKS